MFTLPLKALAFMNWTLSLQLLLKLELLVAVEQAQIVCKCAWAA